MNPEDVSNQESRQPEATNIRYTRAMNAIGCFGVLFTAADIAGTVGNHIHGAIGETPPDVLTVLSLGLAAVGAVVMDRVFVTGRDSDSE